VLDHVQVLKEIMTVYQSSLAEDDSKEDQTSGFRRVLDIMVDPAVEMCVTAADRKDNKVARWDKPIFVLNCLTYLQVSDTDYWNTKRDKESAEYPRTILLHPRKAANDRRACPASCARADRGACRCLPFVSVAAL
jgi:hypothetical protein